MPGQTLCAPACQLVGEECKIRQGCLYGVPADRIQIVRQAAKTSRRSALATEGSRPERIAQNGVTVYLPNEAITSERDEALNQLFENFQRNGTINRN